MPRRLPAPWLAGLGLVLALGGLTFAQPASPPAPPATPPAAPLRAPLVDWSHVQQVHRLAEGWTRAGATAPAGEVDPLRVSGVRALRVTLRWLGMTVGIGDAFTAEQGGEGDVADLAGLTRLATARGLAQILQRVQQQSGAQGKAPLDAMRDIATQLLVDIQVAQSPQRVLLNAGSPPDAVYGQFIPGYHGLRLHRPGAEADLAAAMIWPGTALASNLSPRSQLLQALADLKISHEQLGQIAHPQGPVLERFEVIHMVRPLRELPVTLLVRGQVPLPPGMIDSRTLEAMSQRLADHLMKRQNLGDGSLAGTYLPTSDRHDPLEAAPEDEALAAYALTRWAEVWSQSAGESDRVLDARQAAVRIVNRIVQHLQLDPPTSPPSAALALLTLHHHPQLAAERKGDRDDLAKMLLGRIDREGYVRSAKDEKAPRHSKPAQSLVLAALATHAAATRQPLALQAVALLHSRLWRDEAAGEVAALPWLLMVEALAPALELPPAKGVPDADRRAQMLRNAAETLMRHQATQPPVNGPADIVGGFDLRPATPSPLAPDPDWQSSYGLMLLALGTRHQFLQSPDAAASDTLKLMLRAGLAARFLAQLMVAESGCYYVRNLDIAIGGVRVNLWDNRLAVAPHAMTLLATVEFQAALASARNTTASKPAPSAEVAPEPATPPAPAAEPAPAAPPVPETSPAQTQPAETQPADTSADDAP